VTFFAEMSVTPTEPLGYRAAELAFELDEVFLMFWATLDAPTHCYCCAFAAHEFFFFEILIIIISILTILHSSEIGLAAFETKVIR